MSDREETFEVYVCKESFRFNAAHFMAYPGFRECLHGHNYRAAVRIEGGLGADGYVIDFGDIKSATRAVCSEMNERFLVPLKSDCMTVRTVGGQVEIETEDGSRFSIPERDCMLLPIAHSSAEELAAYLCDRLIDVLEILQSREIVSIEVTVAETPGQEARFRRTL